MPLNDNITSLNSKLTPTQLSITPETITDVSYQYASVIKSGYIVTVQLKVVFASKPSGYVTIYSGLPHALTAIYQGIINDNGTIGGLAAVNTNGNFLVNPNAAGTFFIQFTYIGQ